MVQLHGLKHTYYRYIQQQYKYLIFKLLYLIFFQNNAAGGGSVNYGSIHTHENISFILSSNSIHSLNVLLVLCTMLSKHFISYMHLSMKIELEQTLFDILARLPFFLTVHTSDGRSLDTARILGQE